MGRGAQLSPQFPPHGHMVPPVYDPIYGSDSHTNITEESSPTAEVNGHEMFTRWQNIQFGIAFVWSVVINILHNAIHTGFLWKLLDVTTQ